MASTYDSIRELDKERRGNRVAVPEMSVENYMIPPPFWELGSSIKEEDGEEPSRPVKCANRDTRIRVKNVRTGVSFEFLAMINAARFVGTTGGNMRCGIAYVEAKMYRVGEEEYVFEYDGVERPTQGYSTEPLLTSSIGIVSSTGERTLLFSYLSVAKYLGLLIGHVEEEEKRAREGEPSRRYALGKKRYTLEFDGERREGWPSRDIVCHWKGIYDGGWEKISRIKVTYGIPIKRDNSY